MQISCDEDSILECRVTVAVLFNKFTIVDETIDCMLMPSTYRHHLFRPTLFYCSYDS